MALHHRIAQQGFMARISRWSIALCAVTILAGCASIFDTDDSLPHTARNVGCAGDSSALALPHHAETNATLAQDDAYTMDHLRNDCAGRPDH